MKIFLVVKNFVLWMTPKQMSMRKYFLENLFYKEESKLAVGLSPTQSLINWTSLYFPIENILIQCNGSAVFKVSHKEFCNVHEFFAIINIFIFFLRFICTFYFLPAFL